MIGDERRAKEDEHNGNGCINLDSSNSKINIEHISLSISLPLSFSLSLSLFLSPSLDDQRQVSQGGKVPELWHVLQLDDVALEVHGLDAGFPDLD